MLNFRPNNNTNITTNQKRPRTAFNLEDDETDNSYNYPNNTNEQEKSEDHEIMTLKHEYQLKKNQFIFIFIFIRGAISFPISYLFEDKLLLIFLLFINKIRK